MFDTRLLEINLKAFKSYLEPTRIPLAPLTVLVGRNNCGKSTLIQALLLLRQTLAHPRSDVPLYMEGHVDALNLEELIHRPYDWGKDKPGFVLALQWRSSVDVNSFKEAERWPDPGNLERWTGITDLDDALEFADTRLELKFTEEDGRTEVAYVTLESHRKDGIHRVFIRRDSDRWRYYWGDIGTDKITVEWDHFLPYLSIDRSKVGPRHQERAYYNAFQVLFAQPIRDLRRLLLDMQYLGSTRALPPPLYRPATIPPAEIGASGEYAAQLIHARRADVVHYLPPLEVVGSQIQVPDTVRARPLVEAVNDVMTALGVEAPLEVRDIQNVGFRLLFGGASLAHVGRGLTYLLPVVELGLFSDPLRFRGPPEERSLAEYLAASGRVSHLALEEPEAHLHPKVQTRLAHWLVALAMANRQIIVETHSDHLVRRLRGLAARAKAGSTLEVWLRENVVILEVEKEHGVSAIKATRLTPTGGLREHWPAEFMDEAGDEESAIYYAGLEKPDVSDGGEDGPLESIPESGPEPEQDAQP